ncbi:protein FAR1-RELATED SEQUENCE [Citrus sinensis]|uniref:Protein FAR1-RELATED SEQUENCE n=1 Tax=Citrus sinensis TaxID=2711 RepID=A0ACB8L8T3_CITSI|nr:protein FAR1-RELATED SEQUENCE [Citrus sinensis]
MSSASDSETEWESRYEIHDVLDDARFSECEDGWADDEGDEVAMVNIPVNQQEGEQCDQFESHTNIHGNSGTDQEGTNYRGLKSMDIVGKEFVSEAEAESFFIEYARVMGFGKKFVEREDRKREARPITRTGCGVEFRVAIKDDTSRWVCTHFNGNHNHNLTPPHHVHYIRSHRRLSEADIAAAFSLNAVGVRPSQIHEYMVERSGGYRDVGYLRKDVQNCLDYEKRRQLQESDAEASMEGKQPKTVITDGDKAMRNAISNKFPDAHYRLCCWHLGRNAQANVNKDFTVDFRRCMLRPYTEERFEVKWKEIVQRHNVESHEWVMKMYKEKAMWAEAYLRGKFFGGMRSTQRSEGLNVYLNHYVNIKLHLIAFVKQMDRLIDRQREAAAAEAYTRAMFRLVRDQILQEGMLIAVEWKVSEDECRVHIQGTWDTVSCTCLMMETVGIPCSHLFAVMKVENLEAISRCMILPRWKKEAKVGVTSEVQERCSQHYMSVEARMGSLHAACRTLQRFAAQSSQAYELAITEIHKVSMQLEAMSCETAKDKPKRHMRRRFEVQDPVIVLTKSCRKKQKMGPPQQKKCRRCGNGGHTVRTCKTHLHRPGDKIDCPTQSSQFMADNTILFRRRRSAIGKTADECNKINAYDHHYSQPSNNSHAASSNSWYPQFGMSTDNDSTDDTMMQGLIPQYVLPNASTSTFASNYANIWGHNRI